jgi:sulfofructose kinase
VKNSDPFRSPPYIQPLPQARFDAVCFGYNSVDYLCLLPDFPKRGGKMRMKQLHLSGGGQSATAAAALKAMGFETRYLGKFGGDELGEISRGSLESIGVDSSECVTAADCRNQTAIIWIEDNSGERTITYIRDPGLDVLPHDFNESQVACGRVFLADVHCLPATISAARHARKAGMPVILDVERNLDGCAELLAEGDYLLCDQSFPSAFTGIGDPHAALAKLGDIFTEKVVACTLGQQGSLAYFKEQFLRTPAFIVQAIDTTGAGDVFHAGFAAGLLRGYDLFGCFEIANAAAALACRGLGGRASLGDWSEALSFVSYGPRRPVSD